MPEAFGPWQDEPYGDGVYEFEGERRFPISGAMIGGIDELVKVRTLPMPNGAVVLVERFGKGHAHRLIDYKGRWRKFLLELKEERER